MSKSADILHFPATPDAKALAKANAWLKDRRVVTADNKKRNSEWMGALFEGISESMSDLGISAVQIGDTRINLDDPVPLAPALSARWTEHLAKGGDLFVLEVNSLLCGYGDKAMLNPEDRTLDQLIDSSLVASLAPSATVYGPGQEVPWSEVMPKYGFQIWLTDHKELKDLWARMDDWFKVEWHDSNAGPRRKYKQLLPDVAVATITKILAPDLDMRLARAARAEQMVEAANEMGGQDQTAQADLKRAISALVSVETHPVLGAAITKMIAELIPHLALSMDGKRRYQAIVKAERAAHNNLWQGIKKVSIRYRERPSKLPKI